MKDLKVWSVTDGGAGMLSQSDGLARALNENFINKNCKIRPWFRFLPVALQVWLFPYISEHHKDFAISKPDVVVGVGRDSIPALRWLKKRDPQTFTIYGQNPGILQARYFDLVIATEHNHFESKNTIITKFALHKLTQPILNKAAKEFLYLFEGKPKPWKSIIIGGKAPHYDFSSKETLKLIEDIQKIIKSGGSVFITPSRRTGQENIELIENTLSKFGDQIYLYKHDQDEKNPYIGMLALSDELYITEDSVSMVSEACYTGKPVTLLPLYNFKRRSIKKFTQNLISEKRVRYLSDINSLTSVSKQDDKEMDLIAAKVKKIIQNHFRLTT